ncbi:MAG: single-stranded DNA-binding protein [Intestinibacter sp.]
MNEAILIGRLTVDPELRFLSTGTAVAKFFYSG